MTKKKNKEVASKESSSGLKAKLLEFRDFFEQSKVEMKKVTWPTRKETLRTCSSVLFMVIVVSVFLGLVDMGWAKIIEAILS
jgi:preprotein translocase subunit SecE